MVETLAEAQSDSEGGDDGVFFRPQALILRCPLLHPPIRHWLRSKHLLPQSALVVPHKRHSGWLSVVYAVVPRTAAADPAEKLRATKSNHHVFGAYYRRTTLFGPFKVGLLQLGFPCF